MENVCSCGVVVEENVCVDKVIGLEIEGKLELGLCVFSIYE